MRLRSGRGTRAARMRRIAPVALVTALLLGLQLGLAAAARADGGDFSIDYAAAAPDTYDHSTGTGGEYADGSTPHAVESLEAADFTCGDIVEFFDAVTVDGGASGTQAITIVNSFSNDSTGQSGVGFGDVIYAAWNAGDSGNNVSGNETVTLTNQESVNGNTVATIDVTGLEAGEEVIVAIGVQLVCPDPDNATGNVQTALESAQTSEGDPINTGQQTVPLMHVGQVAPPPPVPAIAVTKECPAKVTAGSDVDVTITVTNTGEETLNDITVTDSIAGDLSDSFADSLDPGQSDTETFSVPTDPTAPTHDVTDTVTATGTGAESSVTATSSDSCTTTVEEAPGAPPSLPPTGFSGAGGLSAVWLFGVAGLVLMLGVGFRYAARRRS